MTFKLYTFPTRFNFFFFSPGALACTLLDLFHQIYVPYFVDLYSVFGISCNDKHEGEISNVADVEYPSCVKQTKAITSHSCFSSLKVNVLCDLHRGIKFSYSSR